MQATNHIATHLVKDNTAFRLVTVPTLKPGELPRIAARIGRWTAGAVLATGGLSAVGAFVLEALREAHPLFLLVHWPMTLLLAVVALALARVAPWR